MNLDIHTAGRGRTVAFVFGVVTLAILVTLVILVTIATPVIHGHESGHVRTWTDGALARTLLVLLAVLVAILVTGIAICD